MKSNMGSTDRIIRAVLGIVLLFLILSGSVAGTFAWILGIVALLLLVTSAIRFCPAYVPLGMSTLKKGEK